MEDSSDTIGNRTRDLATCSAVPLNQLRYGVPKFKQYQYIFILGGFKTTYCNAWGSSTWPKHVAYVDKTNRSSLWLTAVRVSILVRHTAREWSAQEFLHAQDWSWDVSVWYCRRLACSWQTVTNIVLSFELLLPLHNTKSCQVHGKQRKCAVGLCHLLICSVKGSQPVLLINWDFLLKCLNLQFYVIVNF